VLVGLYLPLLFLLYQMGPSGFLTRAMPQVGTNLWGGLLLTFLLTIVGIVFSFPLGILLALGRRSVMPIIRVYSQRPVRGRLCPGSQCFPDHDPDYPAPGPA